MTSSASYCTTADIDPTIGNPGSPCEGLAGAPAPNPCSYGGGSDNRPRGHQRLPLDRAYARSVVVAGLIVPGVIVFLAVQSYTLYGLFERLFERIFGRGRSAGELATFPVPGEAQVTLPVGKVKLRYQESYRAWSGGEGEGIDFGVPAKLQVGVTSPEGESLDIKGPGFRGMGASLQVGDNWSRALVGTVEIVRPGEYTITAGPELKDAVEPQILVGG
jgi:hypothetical protein